MIDTLMDVISNGVIACCGVFALLAAMGFLFYFLNKFITYILEKLPERHNKLKEKEPK